VCMTTKIKLGSEVVVSDPCYEIPTWCQAQVEGVLPGVYNTTARKTETDGWGNRISYLTAIHEDYVNDISKLKWKRYPVEIGVDSGQAGIFDMETYRNDSIASSIGLGDGDISFFSQEPWNTMNPDEESGAVWYKAMCSRTLGKKSWGTYEQGVVTSSGLGDGSYDLYVAKEKDKIVGFIIDFQCDDGEEGETYPPGKMKNRLHPALYGL